MGCQEGYCQHRFGFLHSDRVIGISYQPGFRGGVVERIVSLSPEIPKPPVVSICERGDVSGSSTALGFTRASDATAGWYFWEIEQRMERCDEDWFFADHRSAIVEEITGLYGHDGRTLADTIADGDHVSFASHWDVHRLRQIWPNARYVIPHWRCGYRWFRDVYSKVHAMPLHKAESDDISAISKARGMGIPGITTIIEYHAWKWSGLSGWDRSTVRDFMRGEIPRILAKQRFNRCQPNTHTLDLSKLFSVDWFDEYLRLCTFCGITPVPELCESLLESYNNRQWSR
jgi:hypothetical protein